MLIICACTSPGKFGDVHLTDENGNAIGGGSDPNEWKVIASPCDSIQENTIYPAYPNPAIDVIFFDFFVASSSDLILKTIDTELSCIDEYNASFAFGFNRIALNLDKIESGTTARLEYTITQGDCIYTGYGDIQKQ